MNTDTIYKGDCLKTLKTLPSSSVDLLVTDPPYGYSFMGKDWDKAVPSVEVWKECVRVLKPGAFAFVMSAPRQDVLSQMIVRLGEAGFDTSFTSIYWTYSSGFPKASNIGKKTEKKHLQGSFSGFQPKPAVEIIIVAMKPITEKTYVAQAMSNGKGVTWLDDCRIPYANDKDMEVYDYGRRGPVERLKKNHEAPYEGGWKKMKETPDMPAGRFPANLLVSDDVLNDGTIYKQTTRTYKAGTKASMLPGGGSVYKKDKVVGGCQQQYSRYFSLDEWDEKAKSVYPFIICTKAGKKEKNAGCDKLKDNTKFTAGMYSQSGVCKTCGKTYNGTNDHTKCCGEVEYRQMESTNTTKNNHPTVKPLKLMRYLITLGSRPGDVVLDPFAGSGTTLVAAKQTIRRYIGCELSKEYCEIAEARLEAADKQSNEDNIKAHKGKGCKPVDDVVNEFFSVQ